MFFDVDTVLDAARDHATDAAEPDHETGDLQQHLRAIWGMLTQQQKDAFFALTSTQDILSHGSVTYSQPQAENIAVEALYIAIDHNRTVSKNLHYLKINNPLQVSSKSKQLQSMANIDEGISTIAYLMNNADFEWASTQAEDMGTDASTELVVLLDTVTFHAIDENDNAVETISVSIPELEELLKTSKDGMLFFAPEGQEDAFEAQVMGDDQIIEESAYTNHYTHCGQNWEMTADSQCNDRCPICNAEIEPHHSVEVE